MARSAKRGSVSVRRKTVINTKKKSKRPNPRAKTITQKKSTGKKRAGGRLALDGRPSKQRRRTIRPTSAPGTGMDPGKMSAMQVQKQYYGPVTPAKQKSHFGRKVKKMVSAVKKHKKQIARAIEYAAVLGLSAGGGVGALVGLEAAAEGGIAAEALADANLIVFDAAAQADEMSLALQGLDVTSIELEGGVDLLEEGLMNPDTGVSSVTTRTMSGVNRAAPGRLTYGAGFVQVP